MYRGRHLQKKTRAMRRVLTQQRRLVTVLAAISTAAVAGISLQPVTAGAGTFQGYAPQLTRAPWLTDLTQNSVQVSWATATQATGVVEYGPPGNCTANLATATRMGNPITIGTTTEYQNSIAVTGLSPSTTYCYRLTNTGTNPVDLLGSNSSPQFSTMQPPGGTQPFTFDVLGDWGDTTNGGTNDGSLNVNQAGVDSQIASSGAQFAVSVGDVAYPGGTQTEYGDLNQTGANVSAIFGPSFWATPGQTIPIHQVDGNHGQNVNSINNWPEFSSAAASGGSYAMTSYPSIDGSKPGSFPDTYYAFSTGGVRFYMLDAAWGNGNTGTATGGACGSNCAIYQVDHDAHWTAMSAEYQWLARDLAAHPGGLKFAFFHFPLYTDNSTQTSDAYLDNTSGSTGTLEQLLNNSGAQFAFSGHAHIYQRSIAVPGGVTSYVTGGGGAQAEPVSHCSTTDAYAIGWSYSKSAGSVCGAATAPTSDSQVYHFLKVSVNGANVTVTPTNSQGGTFDVQTYNFASDSTPPSAPGSLAVTVNSQQDVLNWKSATDNVGVVAYDVYRNGVYVATVGPQVTKYTDATGTSGVAYTYRVAARDLAGNTTSATLTSGGTPDTTAPTAPSNLTGSATGYTTASLSWGAATDNIRVQSYAILRNGTPVASAPAGTTSYADTGLAPGATYNYQVTAVDSSGNQSTASNPAGVTTQADTSPPSAPASPVGTSAGSSQVWLSWGASADNVGVVRYDVVRNGTDVASVAGTNYIDNTTSGSTNSYQIVTYDAAGNSTASNSFQVTTPLPGTVFSDGFETGDLSQWTTVSGITAENALAHSGTYGAEESSTGLATYAYKTLPGSYNELWAKAWVYVKSRSTSANLFGYRGSNGGSIINLYLSPTGKLSLRNNVGGVTTTSATSMPTSGWHSLVLHLLVNGASSSVGVSLDGSTVSDLSLAGQNFGTNLITTLQLGETSTGRTYDIDFDDVSVSQSSF